MSHPNPMHSRCGLEDCDCGYVIEVLQSTLKEASVQLQGAAELLREIAGEGDDSWAAEKATQCEAADKQARAAIQASERRVM